jgi:putative (di)nucleoside polyphosphate hydrolase
MPAARFICSYGRAMGESFHCGFSIKVLQVIDPDGFRPNVGIILSNRESKLLWARRVGQDAWQFPQGGMRSDETPAEAMYRELREEVGLQPEQVELIGATRGWLRYRLPARFIRRSSRPVCIGQKQVWFLLRMLCTDRAVCLDHTEKPEFDRWRWVDYWQPLDEVVAFKRNVYRKALQELAPLLFPDGMPGSRQ